MRKVFQVQASELVKKNSIKSEKRFLVKRLIKESLYNSTAQALVKVYNSSSRLTQLFWCVCLAGACGLCSYFVIQSLIDFFTYDVTLSTRTYFETTSLFPKNCSCLSCEVFATSSSALVSWHSGSHVARMKWFPEPFGPPTGIQNRRYFPVRIFSSEFVTSNFWRNRFRIFLALRFY